MCLIYIHAERSACSTECVPKWGTGIVVKEPHLQNGAQEGAIRVIAKVAERSNLQAKPCGRNHEIAIAADFPRLPGWRVLH